MELALCLLLILGFVLEWSCLACIDAQAESIPVEGWHHLSPLLYKSQNASIFRFIKIAASIREWRNKTTVEFYCTTFSVLLYWSILCHPFNGSVLDSCHKIFLFYIFSACISLIFLAVNLFMFHIDERFNLFSSAIWLYYASRILSFQTVRCACVRYLPSFLAYTVIFVHAEECPGVQLSVIMCGDMSVFGQFMNSVYEFNVLTGCNHFLYKMIGTT
jgi:hypothetical protein